MKACLAVWPLLVLALIFPAPAGAYDPSSMQTGPTGESLMRDVLTYARMGDHRTATEADRKTTAWMSKRLAKAGFTVERMTYTVPQFFPASTDLRVGGKPYQAFPLWPARATKGPVSATLAFYDEADPLSVKGKIAVCSVPFEMGWGLNRSGKPGDPAPVDYLRKLSSSGAIGAIYVVQTNTNEILAMNVPVKAAPWPIPIILARYGDLASLKQACAQGQTATFSIKGSFKEKAETCNLVARYGSGGKLMVVTTPLTGWFQCAGERGPGVAMFLALAESIGKRKPTGVSYLFVGTSGHELGYRGQEVFMETLNPKPEGMKMWLHLGASIGTWSSMAEHPAKYDLPGIAPTELKNLLSAPQFVPILEKNFADVFGYKPNAGRLDGELLRLIKEGYPTFGLWGFLNSFHTRGDTPDNTAPELLEPIAKAVIQSVADIENMP